MTADDLNKPLGQRPRKQRRATGIPVPHIMAGVLALFLGAFVIWSVVDDDPLGGEPLAVAPFVLHPTAMAKSTEPPANQQAAALPGAVSPQPGPAQGAPSGTKTVTIIDGKTGTRQEVVIPAPGADAASGAGTTAALTVDPKFIEMTPQGPIPKIAADGVRPAEAFARPVQALPGKANPPRVALIVGGLGVSASATAEAIAKLPGAVTLAFTPYGTNVAALVTRARDQGHEILLQVPMEPFDYPDNDPGPQTLLTSLTPQQNIDRLYWLMSRFQGYVGVTDTMGARFTASEPAFAPVLREIAKRGLIFVDDGSNARSVAGQIAGANTLPFARADVVLDSVPTPDEIDHALGRLEMMARERSVAVGIASALPVSIAHIAEWAKAAARRGLQLIPITAVAVKPKQS